MSHLLNFTPNRFRCGEATPTCPAVLRTETNTYYIIGTLLDPFKAGIASQMASYEAAVEIPVPLVDEAIAASVAHTKRQGIRH